MALIRLSPPGTLPVSLAELRAQCRVSDDDHNEDALLAGYARTATDWVEQQLGVVLLASDWEYHLAGFPSGYAPSIGMPIGPVLAVDQVVYVDTAGVSQVMPSSDYQLAGSKLWPAHGLSWPAARYPSDIVITVRAGLGDDQNSVPEPVRLAVLMLASYWFDQRAAALVGPDHGPASDAPFGVRQLIQPYRSWAF